MTRRNRRHHSRKPFPDQPGKASLRPDVELEDSDGCKTLALHIVHATLTRDDPDDHGRVLTAIFDVLDRPPETNSGVIGYLAQVASEHFQFGCGGKAAAIDQINGQLSELSAATSDRADSAT